MEGRMFGGVCGFYMENVETKVNWEHRKVSFPFFFLVQFLKGLQEVDANGAFAFSCNPECC